MTQESTKRLAPTKETLRELYLKSGNQCAFPGCNKIMINSEGIFVGQICHIEAALPDGQRFNANQTNEERRSFSNLMLMCYEHHKSTDNVDEFPVERLQAMKRAHEDKFADIALKIQESIIDITTLQNITYSTCCKKLSDILGWKISEEDLKECSKEINAWVDKLHKLPPDTRKIFKFMIERSHEDIFLTVVVLNEIEKITGLNAQDVAQHYEMLSRYGFLSGIYANDFGEPICNIKELGSGWHLWNDLKQFANQSSVTLDELIMDLNFSLLDK